MRKSIIAISLALGASVVPIAQAAPVIQWGYSVATTWGPSPIFTSGVGTQVITPAEVSLNPAVTP
jgi:hypothetical protein